MNCESLSQSDLSELDNYLKLYAGGKDVPGVSYTHGFLTAIASNPVKVSSGEWLKFIYVDDASDNKLATCRIEQLTLRLFADIAHHLDTNIGFTPIFEKSRFNATEILENAQPWCLGFTDGLKLYSQYWTREASRVLQQPLSLLFHLADTPHLLGSQNYRLVQAISDAAEFIYCYWKQAREI